MSPHVVAGRSTPRRPPKPQAGPLGPTVPLTSLLETWVADQLITPEQADRILVRGDVSVQAPSAVPDRRHERSSLISEALGYLGGVVILIASVLIASLYWSQIDTTARLVIVGAVAAGLLAAGFFTPERLDGVGTRLRSVLWLLSTGGVAGFLVLLGATELDLADRHVFLLTSAGAAAYATGLWLLGRTPVQQIVMSVSLMLTAAALTNELGVSDALPGVGAWGVALVWLLLGWGGLLAPRRLVVVLGAAGMFAGAMTTLPTHGGIALSLATAATVVAAAVLFRDLLLLAVGALGTLLVLPSAVIELFPGDLAAPVAMLVVGAALVGAGLFVARHRRGGSDGQVGHDFSVGSPAAALTAAGVTTTAVTAFIVILALL